MSRRFSSGLRLGPTLPRLDDQADVDRLLQELLTPPPLPAEPDLTEDFRLFVKLELSKQRMSIDELADRTTIRRRRLMRILDPGRRIYMDEAEEIAEALGFDLFFALFMKGGQP